MTVVKQLVPKNLTLDRGIYLLLVSTIFFLPLQPIVAAGTLILGFILSMVDAFQQRKLGFDLSLPPKIKYPLLALFFLSAFSVLWSQDRVASLYNWFYVVGQDAVIFYLMLRYASKGHRVLFIMKMFLISAALVAADGIWQYLFSNDLQNVEWLDHRAFPELTKRAYATLENPNILGSFLVLAGSYCVGIFAPLRGGKTRIALIFIFLLSTTCLLLTYSRGNWVAFFWVLFVFAAFFYHKALLPFIGGGLGVLYLGWDMLANRLLSIFNFQDTSAELRIAYVESALAMIKEQPWGVGWYGYQFAFPDYDFYLEDPSFIMYHCHNWFLNVAAELGVIGLALLLYLLWQFFLLAKAIRNKKTKPWMRGIACGYIASLVGLAISGLTDYTLFNLQLGMLFWVGNATLLIINRKSLED